MGFDDACLVAGTTSHRVEGRLARQRFSLRDAGMSRLEALRNHENAVKALGGFRIDAIQPHDKEFIASNGGKRGAIVSGTIGSGESSYS